MLKTIYSKTETGRQALKERSVALTPKLRSAFILFDGVRSLPEVLTATAGLGVTADDVRLMVERGFLVASDVPDTAPPPQVRARTAPAKPPVAPAAAPAAAPGHLTESQERYQRAYPLAAQLTASLGLRGFRLNLAVEAAGNLEQLRALAPKIREALGPEKCRELDQALGL